MQSCGQLSVGVGSFRLGGQFSVGVARFQLGEQGSYF